MDIENLKQNEMIEQYYQEYKKHEASYVLSDTIGWRRIASANGTTINARIYICQQGYAFATLSLDVVSLNGWEPKIAVANYRYSNQINRFSKARLVCWGNHGCYVDIYNDYENNNGGKLDIYVDNIHGIILSQSETIVGESVDSKYQVYQITPSYNSASLATTLEKIK